jgi:predicted dehydrogenase
MNQEPDVACEGWSAVVDADEIVVSVPRRQGKPATPTPARTAIRCLRTWSRGTSRLYARMARDLHEGTRSAPSFDDAVAVHRVIAAIERAAESESRTALA